ncbi:MAG: alkaline phosphatase D family protein, partial [Bacteroidota bacterium]
MTLENEAPTTTADLAAEQGAGPVLLLRGAAEGRLLLRALVVRPESAPEERLSADGGEVEALSLLRLDDLQVLAYDFSLPLGRAASYAFGGETYAVNTAWEGDLRIAYTSCNGQESGDRKRPLEKRNVLWQRLARQHEAAPFHVLLQGGDQIYADEVASLHRRARHNPLAAWSYRTQHDIGPLRAAMRRELFRRYLELYRQPQVAHIMARVPMLAIWDDHDICDGWGSLPPERQDSDFGRAVFAVSRELYLLFQHGAVAPDYPPAFGDRDGASLGWHLRLPGLDLIAPDLRSERRRDRVMGEAGWKMLSDALAAARPGRVLLLSSVPALGPRLSWVEALMRLTPRLEKYEDDLRDQWQSRAHREEWRRFLRLLIETHTRGDTPVTVLSGEIHLATRGTMETAAGPLHQLVASGIT